MFEIFAGGFLGNAVNMVNSYGITPFAFSNKAIDNDYSSQQNISTEENFYQ